jgi:drug/metabolite transporter (DMT)-like permease
MTPSPRGEELTFRIVLAYLGVYLIWGSTYLAIRVGVEHLPPALFAGARFALAGMLLLLFGVIKGYAFPSLRAIRDLSIVGLFLLIGGNLLVVWAEQTIPSGLAALIIGAEPLIIATMDSVTPRGRNLAPLGWLGSIIGMVGVVILVSPSIGLAEGERLDLLGLGAILLACILWAIGSLYAQRRHVEGNIFVNAGIQNCAPAIVALTIGIAAGETSQLRFTTQGVLALLYLVVFGSILGYTSYQYLLRHQPPAKATTYAYINPVVAIILGWLILDEPIAARTVVAGVIILLGVALVQTAKVRERVLPQRTERAT